MSLQQPIAYMCEGALYCPDHCSPTKGELEDSFVVSVTEFDIACGDQKVEWLKDSCCSSCGMVFAEYYNLGDI